MEFTEKQISSRRIYKGRIVGLREDTVELPGGKVAKREIVEHPGAVAVIALTNKDEIVLIKQYRRPAQEVLLEVPAGLVHKDETPAEAAKRELEEETGFRAKNIKKIFESYASPGYSTEVIQYFLATDLEKKFQKTEEDELIAVELYKISDCYKMIKEDKIRDNKTIIGVMIAGKGLNEKIY